MRIDLSGVSAYKAISEFPDDKEFGHVENALHEQECIKALESNFRKIIKKYLTLSFKDFSSF